MLRSIAGSLQGSHHSTTPPRTAPPVILIFNKIKKDGHQQCNVYYYHHRFVCQRLKTDDHTFLEHRTDNEHFSCSFLRRSACFVFFVCFCVFFVFFCFFGDDETIKLFIYILFINTIQILHIYI